MQDTLHPTLATYFQTSNARDTEALLRYFAPEAVVVDEGQTYRGAEEIRQWVERTHAAYDFTQEVRSVVEQGGETIVTCRVSGNFPGNPINLRSFFTLDSDRITSLTIRE